MSAQSKPFKISDLPKISHISDDDLLLVSDYDNRKCTSKSIDMSQIASYVNAKIQASLEEVIQQKVAEAIENLDIEPKVVQTLDKIDGVEDNVININSGDAT